MKVTHKGVLDDGTPTLVEYFVKYDGKDYPVPGSSNYDMISEKRIDDFTAEATLKKDGKVVATTQRVVSKDGKVMTITTTGTNAKGQKINYVLVYDKL